MASLPMCGEIDRTAPFSPRMREAFVFKRPQQPRFKVARKQLTEFIQLLEYYIGKKFSRNKYSLGASFNEIFLTVFNLFPVSLLGEWDDVP